MRTASGSWLLRTLVASSVIVIASHAMADSQAVSLQPGWNLIAFQVEPFAPGITSVLLPINGSYDQVWSYDALAVPPLWVGYQPSGPVQTLAEIHGGVGYWIHISSPQATVLEVNGQPISSVFLKSGWNLVGSYCNSNFAVADAVSSLPANSRIWSYDQSSGSWAHFQASPAFLNTLAGLDPGRGYWLNVSQQTLWGGPLLELTLPPTITFGQGTEQYAVRISNRGSGSLQWSIPVGQYPNWVTISPASGTTTTGISVVTVGIDWNQITFPDTQPVDIPGTILFTSNGGAQTVNANVIANPVAGHYEGAAIPTSVNGRAIALSNVKLAMDIFPQASSAIMTAEQTPFFPFDIFFTGSGTGKNLILGSTFSVPVGDPMNMFDRPLVRSVTLRGPWTSNTNVAGAQAGDYTETIEMPGTAPVIIQGTFEMRRTGFLDGPPAPGQTAKTFRPDLDGDAMPTDWEVRYGLNFKSALGPNGATGDPDSDGRNNLQEYWDRTDPRIVDVAPQTPSISGTVTEQPGGFAIPNVSVVLTSATQVLTQTTNAGGGYSFPNLAPGYHTIAIGNYPGFSFTPSPSVVSMARAPAVLNISGTRATTPLLVDFVASPQEGREPLVVQFVTLLSNPDSTAWFWNFGAAGVSSLRDPRVTFAAPGEYAITLATDQGVVLKQAFIRVGDSQTAANHMPQSVHSMLGGLRADADVMTAGAYSLQAVVGTPVAADVEPSQSQNFQLNLDDVP